MQTFQVDEDLNNPRSYPSTPTIDVRLCRWVQITIGMRWPRAFFGSFNRELVHRRRFVTRSQARSEIFEWIEVFSNRQCRHSSLDHLSPAESEGNALVPSSRSGNVSVKAGQAQTTHSLGRSLWMGQNRPPVSTEGG